MTGLLSPGLDTTARQAAEDIYEALTHGETIGLTERMNLPAGTEGVVVARVEAMSPAFDAGIERGHVLLEINRQPVRTVEDFYRLASRARSGDILTLYLFAAESGRALHTLKID